MALIFLAAVTTLQDEEQADKILKSLIDIWQRYEIPIDSLDLSDAARYNVTEYKTGFIHSMMSCRPSMIIICATMRYKVDIVFNTFINTPSKLIHIG